MSKRKRTRSRVGGSLEGPQTATPKHKFGLIPVNNLTYGNPDAEQNLILQKEGQFDYIANHFMDKPYPNNDGNYAKEEIKKILSEMGNLAHSKVVELSLKFDEDLNTVMMETAQKCGVGEPEKFVRELVTDISGIIMNLKYHYNRIRPFQLSNVYGINLSPMPSCSANSPSYPSGHTLESRVFAEILSFRYPEHQDMLKKFAEKCAMSRIILGLHFPSDNVFALQVSAAILKDKNFRGKYLNVKKINEESNTQNQNSRPVSNHQGPTSGGNWSQEEIFGGMPETTKVDSNFNESEVFGGIPIQPGNR
tara:strand:+ start:15 stop:935 length:921 start_codon:yes stop_codon:yes gene_type:complete